MPNYLVRKAASIILDGGESSGAPVILTTDIVNGPTSGGENNNGAYLSIFGVNFGSAVNFGTIAGSRVYINDVEVVSYKDMGTCRVPSLSWMQRLTVQVGALGGLTVGTSYTLKVVTNGVTSNTNFTFKRTNGRMIYVIASGTNGTGTFASPYTLSGYFTAGLQASDHVIMRGGTYGSIYGSQYGGYQMSLGNAAGGGANAHTTFMGYPGETPVWNSTTAGLGSGGGNIRLIDSGENGGAGFVFSNIEARPDVSFIDHGGRGSTQYLVENGTTPPRCKGASDVRVVNVDCIPSYANIHASAHFVVSGDRGTYHCWGARDAVASTVSNLNHTMYISCGSDNDDVGFWAISNIKGGHMIQVHTDYADDSAGYFFENILIHDGVIRSDNPDWCRGVNTGITHPGTANATWGTTGTTYVSFYNIVFDNVGQSFGIGVVNSGNVRHENHTVYNAKAGDLFYTTNLQGTFNAYLNVRNCIIHTATASANPIGTLGAVAANVSGSNNCYRGGSLVYASDPSPVIGDPLFTNAGTGDFSLQAGSSCLNVGTSVNHALRDARGLLRPSGAGNDIGAFERAA